MTSPIPRSRNERPASAPAGLRASSVRALVPFGSVVVALFSALVAPACSDTAAAGARATPIEPEHDGFWWTRIGEQSAAIANFGPSFETADGLYRQWSLVIHLPGTPEPLTCVQGLVDFDE